VRHPRHLRSHLPWLLGLSVVAGSVPVRAQSSAVQPASQLESPEAEAALPDIDAIEKGARPRASQSFRQPPATPPQNSPQPAGQRQSTRLNPTEQQNGAASSERLEEAATGLGPPGGLYGVEAGALDMQGDAPSGPVPEFHTVKKGDTLWSLCQQYFGDAWRWPKLWSENPIITNPHWIFPGDVVRLRTSTGEVAVAPSLGARRTGLQITSTRQGSLASNALVLRTVGYVEAKDLQASAVIGASREEKLMLSTGDQVYLNFDKARPLRAGERYTVFVADLKNPVRRPGDGKVLGYLVRIYGDTVVDQISTDNTARGTLVDMVDPVERGYMVSPVIRQFRRIEPRPSTVTLEARIVATFSAAHMLAAETFVVLSRGRKDGLQVGNRSYIVRRGDGARRMMEDWDTYDPRFPKEVVGELLVVDVNDSTALAWISRSTKEVRVGEAIEMRKGY
jgi:hypothetical protein